MQYQPRYHADRRERRDDGESSNRSPKAAGTPAAPVPAGGARTSYTVKLDADQIKKLGAILSARNWLPFAVDYAAFAYKDEGVNVIAYNSGKVVAAGKRTEEFVQNILEAEVTCEARLGYDEVWHPEWFEHHAGLDESGKGDLFGPLVTACVVATGEMISQWRDLGVRDSKAIASDKAVLALEREIRKTPGVVIKVMWAGMEKYNDLYPKFGSNLNKMLAWYHATALADCLTRIKESGGEPPAWGLLDQFCKTPLTQTELRKRGIKFDLRMRTKAESDPVVAAASIVARAAFVRAVAELSRAAGEPLPKGCGAQAKAVGLRLVEKFGADAFGRFAKLHFKTAYECRGLPAPVRDYPYLRRR
jgi:ribonuclease HIII